MSKTAMDIKNLRFYAEMAREFKWRTDVIGPDVIGHTLNEIAQRIAELEEALRKEQMQAASAVTSNQELRADINAILASNHELKAKLQTSEEALRAAQLMASLHEKGERDNQALRERAEQAEQRLAISKEALDGIEWCAGSNTAIVLPDIKRRAAEAITALRETDPRKADQ